MPDLSWNNEVWGSRYNWTSQGEEWSDAYGSSEAQWFGSIFPRLHRFLPARNVLEIAPGFGRWTKFLLPLSDKYLGIDLSENCVAACKASFSKSSHARFIKNDGMSLDAAENGKYDLIFSFDSLVHAEIDVIDSYVAQSIKKLKRTGAVFFHHSNLLEFTDNVPGEDPHCRARSVSAALVADLVDRHDGKMLVQEAINWGSQDPHDCLTLFARKDFPASSAPVFLRNSKFSEEAALIKSTQSHYAIRRDVGRGKSVYASVKDRLFGNRYGNASP